MELEKSFSQKPSVIKHVEKIVRSKFAHEATGHDFWHLHRVRNLALCIAQHEKADLFIVELAALLHDIADWKFHNGDETIGPRMARELLDELNVEKTVCEHVCDIIATISYKGAGVKTPMKTLEGMIVQDADRLDALGAIGIARCFAYGGSTGRQTLYDPEINVTLHQSAEHYKKSQTSSINHFYEKLLLLKDRMNTQTGRALAEKRHAFMERFLEHFFNEWNGKE